MVTFYRQQALLDIPVTIWFEEEGRRWFDCSQLKKHRRYGLSARLFEAANGQKIKRLPPNPDRNRYSVLILKNSDSSIMSAMSGNRIQYNRQLFILLLCLSFTVAIQAQIFRNTAPPPPPPEPGVESPAKTPEKVYLIDTTFESWELENVKPIPWDSSVCWQQAFPKRSFGKFAMAADRLGFAFTETVYKNGSVAAGKLHFQFLSLAGELLDSLSLTHNKGFSLVSIQSDGQAFYVAYQREINSGNRELYLAKVSSGGTWEWETKIGQRFGISGTGLLQIDKEGRIVLFSQMYDQISFDIFSPAGQYLERKFIYFTHEFSPKSFFFKSNGHLIAIGSHRQYVGRQTISSSVIFELDTHYQLVQYCQLQSPYTDVAQDITADEQGYYYFMTNSENSAAPYGQRPNFTTIGKLNAQFELVDSKNIINTATGLSLRLQYSENQGLLAYQRLWNKGNSFALFQMDSALNINNIYSQKGRFPTSQQLILQKDQVFIGGGDSNSWIMKFSLLDGVDGE